MIGLIFLPCCCRRRRDRRGVVVPVAFFLCALLFVECGFIRQILVLLLLVVVVVVESLLVHVGVAVLRSSSSSYNCIGIETCFARVFRTRHDPTIVHSNKCTIPRSKRYNECTVAIITIILFRCAVVVVVVVVIVVALSSRSCRS